MKKTDSMRCIQPYTKKDGTTTYNCEVRRKNAKPLRDSFTTLTEAKNWVRKVESAILDGKYVPDNQARRYTLSDLIDRYIRLHLTKYPGRLKDQAPHMEWWKENYGRKALVEITPALLAEAKEELLNGVTPRKTKRTNSTVNRYFSSLSRAFTLAYQEWQWINENPFRRVSKLKENPGRNRFLDREELQRLLDCCAKSTNPHLYGMVLIAASMGLRHGEITALQWKHIDFVNGFATLETTKNGDRRCVPLPDRIFAYLKNLERPKPPEDFVFPSKDPLRRHPPSMIRKPFQKALKEAGISNFKYHDLRHTAASHLAMNGATQAELMEILGHRSPTMSKKYTHFTNKHISHILQKTNNNLLGNPGETK
mgnify:CR=1 FL=1